MKESELVPSVEDLRSRDLCFLLPRQLAVQSCWNEQRRRRLPGGQGGGCSQTVLRLTLTPWCPLSGNSSNFTLEVRSVRSLVIIGHDQWADDHPVVKLLRKRFADGDILAARLYKHPTENFVALPFISRSHASMKHIWLWNQHLLWCAQDWQLLI